MNLKELSLWQIVRIILLWVIPWVCVGLFLNYANAKVFNLFNIITISLHQIILATCVVVGIIEFNAKIIFLPVVALMELLKFQIKTTRNIILEY